MKMKKLFNEKIEKDIKSGKDFKSGQVAVLRAYKRTLHYLETDKLVVSTTPWEDEYEDFLNYLKEANIEEFVITSTSSGLINFMCYLVSNGCEVKNAVRIEKIEKNSICDDSENGLVIKINK
jgi:hypothetical protein